MWDLIVSVPDHCFFLFKLHQLFFANEKELNGKIAWKYDIGNQYNY